MALTFGFKFLIHFCFAINSKYIILYYHIIYFLLIFSNTNQNWFKLTENPCFSTFKKNQQQNFVTLTLTFRFKLLIHFCLTINRIYIILYNHIINFLCQLLQYLLYTIIASNKLKIAVFSFLKIKI